MIWKRTVVALWLAIGIAPLANASVPVIPLTDPQPMSQETTPAPAITFSLPKYTLSANERELVASCLVLEAASQGEFGMRGVMAVIRNRSRGLPELFATTILKEKQFSALNKFTSGQETYRRLLLRAQRDKMWPAALTIVDEAANDTWHDPTDGATHYTRVGEHTRWTHMLAQTTIIGRHAFYR